MGEVVDLGEFNTDIDSAPETILHVALQQDLQEVMVIGWDAEGNRYFNTNIPDGFRTLWLIEMTKKKLLEVGDPEPIFAPPAEIK